MNRQTIDFLSAAEKTEIAADVADLMDDAQVSVAVTYQDFQSKTRTPSTGAYVPAYASTVTRAVRTELSAREVAASGGLYQAGDVRFLIAQSDVAATPNREDRIVLGTETYEVVYWTSDPLAQTWAVAARLVKP